MYFRIHLNPNTFSNISLPQYISQYANAVTGHFRLSSNLQVSIYRGAEAKWSLCTQTLCKGKPITAMWQISVRITYHSHVAHQCQNCLNIFLVSVSVDLVTCVSGSSSHKCWDVISIISRILIQGKGLSWIWAEFEAFYETLQCSFVYFGVEQTSWQSLGTIHRIRADFGFILGQFIGLRLFLGYFRSLF